MKRKIALLLAGAMALSAAPTTLFAASDNELTYPNRPVKEKTVFYEKDLLGRGATGDYVDSLGTGFGPGKDNDYIEAYVDGTDLVIDVKNHTEQGAQFELALENADWFFRNYEPTLSNNADMWSKDGRQVLEENWLDNDYRNLLRSIRNGWTGETVSPAGLQQIDYELTRQSEQARRYLEGNFSEVIEEKNLRSLKVIEKFGDDTRKGAVPGYDKNGDLADARLQQTYLYSNGLYVYGINGSSTDARGAYLRLAGLNDREVPYIMMVSDTGIGTPDGYATGRAVVELVKPAEKGDRIVIPLVTRISTGETARVKITNTTSTVTNETLTFGITNGGGTFAYVLDEDRTNEIITARDDFSLPYFVILEKTPNALRGGTAIITAPSGYAFDLHGIINKEGIGGPNDTRIQLEVLEWNGSSAGAAYGVRGVDWDINYTTDSAGYINENEIYLWTNLNNQRLGSTQGKIIIENLRFYALDDTTADNEKVEFVLKDRTDTAYGLPKDATSNQHNGVPLTNITPSQVGKEKMKVTKQTVHVANRSNWDITLSAKDAPTFVNGTYESQTEFSPQDEFHKTARVTFKENVNNSWWAGRTTELVLPEGVKFRQVEITDTKNIDSSLTRDIEQVFKPTKKGTSASTARVIVEEDRIKLRNITTDRDKRAEIEFDLWISIESGFEGDVELSCETYGKDEIKPVVIAKAINPVKIDTKVTDVKIGYQYFPVADFTVTETKAGNLRRNKQVRISVSDLITADMHFATGIKHEITQGDMKVKNVRIGTSGGFVSTTSGSLLGNTYGNGGDTGLITFEIDKVSGKDKPSAIKFTNVQLKIDRTVPETASPNAPSPKPYQLIVWGSAIAENFGDKGDQFGTPGIMTDYVKVVSSANDRTSVLTQEVRVTIGEKYVTIGDEQEDMDAAAYISTASNSTMVPVRFISYAFGIDKAQVLWDDENHRVTINHPNGRVVQFEEKSSSMKINGMDVVMFSPDGLHVAPEIRDERMYVPFRAMGDAFGITTSWDTETQTAVYSPTGYTTEK